MTTAWQPRPAADGSPRTLRLGELAEMLGGALVGDGSVRVCGILPLDDAGPDHVSFIHAASYLRAASASAAAAFLVSANLDSGALDAALGGRPRLAVAHSKLAVARVLEAFFEVPHPAAGVHDTAVVGEGCELAPDVHVGPYAVLGDGCRLGAGTVVEAHVVVGRRCILGRGVWLHAGAVLYDDCRLGDRVRIHSGAVIGAHGFGYATVGGVHLKIPQVGHVVLGDDVEVGANSAVDRALADATRIGAGTKIDNLVQIGHNVETGEGCLLCGQVGVAGTTTLGNHVVLSGQVGAVDHVHIGDGVQVVAGTKILRDVEPGRVVGGTPPLFDVGDWRRVSATLGKLPELLRKVRRLERQVESRVQSADAADEGLE